MATCVETQCEPLEKGPAVVKSTPSKDLSSARSDTLSHLMHLGFREFEAGNIDAKPLLCAGWLYFKNPVSMTTLRQEVTEKIVSKILRYRALPVERDGWTYWDEIEGELDLDYHFQSVGTFSTEEEWQQYLENLSEEGLDYSKPWWRYVLVEKLPCGRSAVIGLSDHTLGDGASQMSALLSMSETNTEDANPVFQKKAEKSSATPVKKIRARQLTTYEKFAALFRGIYRPLSEGVLPADTHTKLKVPSEKKFPKGWKFATTKPEHAMDLKMLKDIKNRVPGCTVNDVMLTLTALAIKRYYIDIDDPIMSTKKDITATYAVNARPAGVNYLSDKWFGNHIVIATTPYPLHSTRVGTLMRFRDDSRIRKNSPDTGVRKFLMNTLSTFAKFMSRDALVKTATDINLKYSIMISNVLLSLKKIKIFGQEIDDVQFLAFAPMGCYCGVATYGDKVNCNIVVAKECESNPYDILPYYNKELEILHKEIMEMSQDELIRLDRPKTISLTLVISLAILFLSALFFSIY